MSNRKLMKFGNVDTSMMLAPAREIMSQREGKHDKTDKVRQKRMPKKENVCSLEISSKNFTINP
jgi:hypothetical protein